MLQQWDLSYYAATLELCSLPEFKEHRSHLSLFYLRQLSYPSRNGRTNLFPQSYAHTNPFLYSFFPQTISVWISLPYSVASSPSVLSFKHQLLSYV